MLLINVGLAAALRLGGLGAESFWWDEVLTTYSAREPVTRMIQSVRDHENAPPLYFIVVNLWAHCFGMSDVALRLPSALMGIATVALLWRVGTELFDNTIGLTAAALLAVSPIHVAYSQEARMYALLVLLLTLNLWAAVRVMSSGSTRWQVAYVATAAMALLTHTFAAFTLLAVNLFWLKRFMRPGQTGVTWRRWLTLNAAVLVLFGPWVPATLEVARMGLPWLSTSTTFRDAIVGYAGGIVAAIALAGLCGLAIVWAWRRRDDRVVLLLLLALIPVIGPIAYGAFTTRYGIAAVIGLTMLAAYAAAAMGRWACVTVALLAAVSWSMASTLGHARYLNYTPKVDVRSAVQFIRGRANSRDAIVAGSRGIWHVAEHYTQGSNFRVVDGMDALASTAGDHVWLIEPAGPSQVIPGYDERSGLPLDGVIVRELWRREEPAATRSVPSTYPRN